MKLEMRQKLAREPFAEKIRKVGQLIRLAKTFPRRSAPTPSATYEPRPLREVAGKFQPLSHREQTMFHELQVEGCKFSVIVRAEFSNLQPSTCNRFAHALLASTGFTLALPRRHGTLAPLL